MQRRFGVVLVMVMVLTMAFAQNGFCITISQLRKDLLEKSERFDKRVKDMTMEMETTAFQDGSKMGVSRSKIFRKGLKVRIESRVKVDTREAKSNEITTTMVYDGENVWMINPLGEAMKMEGMPKEQMDPVRFIPEDARILEEEEVDGHLCYVVSYTKFGVEQRLWIDKKRLIPLKMESSGEGAILFKDYRKVAGMWGMPNRILVVDGAIEITSNLKKLEINTGLSDGLFMVEQVNPRALRR